MEIVITIIKAIGFMFLVLLALVLAMIIVIYVFGGIFGLINWIFGFNDDLKQNFQNDLDAVKKGIKYSPAFDFLRKNKNIENDNGLNEIYARDGKGYLKEKFYKKNGKKHGLYQEYYLFLGGYGPSGNFDEGQRTHVKEVECNYNNGELHGLYNYGKNIENYKHGKKHGFSLIVGAYSMNSISGGDKPETYKIKTAIYVDGIKKGKIKTLDIKVPQGVSLYEYLYVNFDEFDFPENVKEIFGSKR